MPGAQSMGKLAQGQTTSDNLGKQTNDPPPSSPRRFDPTHFKMDVEASRPILPTVEEAEQGEGRLEDTKQDTDDDDEESAVGGRGRGRGGKKRPPAKRSTPPR